MQEFHAQERGRIRDETNERLGGLEQRNGNDRLPGRGPMHGPVKDQRRHPVLRMPGTAVVRLSVKDRSLGPDQEVDREVDQEAHREGTGQGVQVRVGLRVAARKLVRKDFRRVPAGIVPGLPSNPLPPAVPKGDLQFPFDQAQAVAPQQAPGLMRLGRRHPCLAPLKV
jgi:hypothetical protein